MNTALIGALALAAIACGGAKSDPTVQPTDVQQHAIAQPAPAGEHAGMAAAGEHGEAGEHGGKLPPAVSKFHDTLAPRWHAERGAKRVADTCAAMPQFLSDAAAIVAAPAPEGANPTSWSAGGTQLADAVRALDTICKANDAVAFEPAFERLHASFHHVMEAGGAH